MEKGKKFLIFILMNFGYVGFLYDVFTTTGYQPIIITWVMGILCWIVSLFMLFEDEKNGKK